MIRASNLGPINRYCTVTRYRQHHHHHNPHRATPTSTLSSTKCLLGHVWISEEGLILAFNRFFAHWRRTTFDNTSASCDHDNALARNYASRCGEQNGGIAVSKPTSSTGFKDARNSLEKVTLKQRNVPLLRHQHFPPGIKQATTSKGIYQARTVVKLPERDGEAPEQVEQDMQEEGSWNASTVLRQNSGATDYLVRHDARYIRNPNPYAIAPPPPPPPRPAPTSPIPGYLPTPPIGSNEMDDRPMTLTALRSRYTTRYPIQQSVGDPFIGITFYQSSRPIADAPDSANADTEMVQEEEEGLELINDWSSLAGDQFGISKAGSDTTLPFSEVKGSRQQDDRVTKLFDPAKILYKNILPQEEAQSEEVWTSFWPTDDPYGDKEYFRLANVDWSTVVVDYSGNSLPRFDSGTPTRRTKANWVQVDNRYLSLVYTAVEARDRVEQRIPKLLNLYKERKRGLELEHALSKLIFREELRIFVDMLHGDRLAKTGVLDENRSLTPIPQSSNKTGTPTTGDWIMPVIMGYRMLRLIMPRESVRLRAWNLKNLLASLVAKGEWRAALWILYEETAGLTRETPNPTSDATDLTRDLSEFSSHGFVQGWKIILRRMVEQDHFDIFYFKNLNQQMALSAAVEPFENVERFRALLSTCDKTEDLMSIWAELQKYRKKTESSFAIPAMALLVDRAVELRLNYANVWAEQNEPDLIFMCVDLFLSLDGKEQAMLLGRLVSFLEAWMDLGAQQANELFTKPGNMGGAGVDNDIRRIPYLSAFVLFLDRSVCYEAVRAIFQRLLLQEIGYTKRNRGKRISEIFMQSQDIEGFDSAKGRSLQDRLLNLFEKESPSTVEGVQKQGADDTLRRPWSLETLWPLFEVLQQEPSVSLRSETFPKEWMTRELGEMLLEYKGRYAVSMYLRESSDVEVLMFLARAWLRRSNRLKGLRKRRKTINADMPTAPTEFKEYILRKIMCDIDGLNAGTTATGSETSNSAGNPKGQPPAIAIARAIFTLEEIGFETTTLTSEIFYTLMSLRRTGTIVFLTKFLRLRLPPDQRLKCSLPTMKALANYLTLHHPPAALFFLARLPGRSIAEYGNFVALHAGGRHHLARVALLEFLSSFSRAWPGPYLHQPQRNNVHRLKHDDNHWRVELKSRRPVWEWWTSFPSAADARRSARDMLAAYARGIAVSEELQPQQSVRRSRAALSMGLRLRLGPDVRVAEAVVFCAVVRMAQQELLKTKRSSLLDVAEFVRRAFSSARVGFYLRVLYKTARDEQDAVSKERRDVKNVRYACGGKKGRYFVPWAKRRRMAEELKRKEKVAERAELFVKWLREVVWVMKCKGGKLSKEDIKGMYCLDGDPSWKPGGVRMDEDD